MKYISIFFVLLLFGCQTSEHYVQYQDNIQPRPENCSLDIYAENLELNKNTKIIGEIQIEDAGFSINCDADTVIKQIKKVACQQGAHAIHLYDVKPPSRTTGSCFQAKARFLIYVE